MNTVSLVNSLSRRAGGLFESVRRLHQELLGSHEDTNGRIDPRRVDVRVLGMRDEFTHADIAAWDPVPVAAFDVRGPGSFGYAPGLSRKLNALLRIA